MIVAFCDAIQELNLAAIQKEYKNGVFIIKIPKFNQ